MLAGSPEASVEIPELWQCCLGQLLGQTSQSISLSARPNLPEPPEEGGACPGVPTDPLLDQGQGVALQQDLGKGMEHSGSTYKLLLLCLEFLSLKKSTSHRGGKKRLERRIKIYILSISKVRNKLLLQSKISNMPANPN